MSGKYFFARNLTYRLGNNRKFDRQKFGVDGIPLNESHLSLAGYRSKRDLSTNRRERRSYLYYSPVNITERVTQEYIQSIIANINFAEERQEDSLREDQIDFLNPIHVSLYDYY